MDEFGAECEQQIKQLYSSYREEAASGFLLLYPKYMVHMLEVRSGHEFLALRCITMHFVRVHRNCVSLSYNESIAKFDCQA